MTICLGCLSLCLGLVSLGGYKALGQIPPVDYDNLTVQFGASEFYVAEDGGTANIVVTLSDNVAQTVTVDYSTSDDTATAPTDYQPASGTLTFYPGQPNASFQVTINNAGFAQDLNVDLQLSNPTGGIQLGGPSVATLVIVPSNYSPSVAFDFSDYYVAEDDENATIYVTLSGPCSQPVSVNYSTSDGTATAPTDYQATSGTLFFSPNQTSASFQVNVNNVGFSQNLTVNLTLSSPWGCTMGSQSTAVLTIVPANTTCP